VADVDNRSETQRRGGDSGWEAAKQELEQALKSQTDGCAGWVGQANSIFPRLDVQPGFLP
jgi:hypothetical protein